MDTDVQLAVVVARRESVPVWWAPASRWAESVIGNLPTHRDTSRGRRNAAQLRLALLAVGVLVVVLWQSFWAPFALILCLVALVVPMSESRRRQLAISLRTRRQHTRINRKPGQLVIDARHVTLTQGEERVRHLRRSVLRVTRGADSLELSAGGKKKERLLVANAEPADEELWVETEELDAIETAVV